SIKLRRRLNAPETVPGHSGLGSNLGHLIPNPLFLALQTVCIAFGSLFASCFSVTSPDCLEVIEHSANAKPIVVPNVFVKPASEIVPELAKSTLDSFPHLCNKIHNSRCNLGSSITDHLAQGKDQRRDRVANSRSRLRNSLAYSSNDLRNRGYKRSSDLADTLDNTLDELHEHPGNTFDAFQECSEVNVGKQCQTSCKIANEPSRR